MTGYSPNSARAITACVNARRGNNNNILLRVRRFGRTARDRSAPSSWSAAAVPFGERVIFFEFFFYARKPRDFDFIFFASFSSRIIIYRARSTNRYNIILYVYSSCTNLYVQHTYVRITIFTTRVDRFVRKRSLSFCYVMFTETKSTMPWIFAQAAWHYIIVFYCLIWIRK